MPDIKAIDCLIIPSQPGRTPEALSYLFTGLKERIAGGISAEQLVKNMDAAGVEKGILSIQSEEDRDWCVETARRFKGRFLLALAVNPHGLMDELRRCERYVKDYGVVVWRFGPWRIQKPPNDRIYFPFYAKAVELGIACQINVGIPGPKTPGWTQDPIYVDEVCYLFPELKVLMTHLGDPWIGTVIKMLLRWENCYLVTNSVAPKFWPEEFIRFINTRGSDKVLFGTEYPILDFSRALREIAALPLRDPVRPKLLRENALRLFRWE